jgi:hypothetical protein
MLINNDLIGENFSALGPITFEYCNSFCRELANRIWSIKGDHLHNITLNRRVNKSHYWNLQTCKNLVSAIVFRDVRYSIPCAQEALERKKFLDQSILLPLPFIIQLDGYPDAFWHFMEIRNDLEPQFSPEINEDLMLLA